MLEDLIYPDEGLRGNRQAHNLGPMHKPRLDLGPPESGSDTEGLHQPNPGTVALDRTSLEPLRPQAPLYNRTNLVLTRNSQVGDDDLQTQEYRAVSPFPGDDNEGYAENELPAGRSSSRPPPVPRVSPRFPSRDFLSPSSASVGHGSRRGLGEIHEMDTGGVYLLPDDDLSHSDGSVGWRGRQ